jgi:hypothetical protein
MSDMTDALLDEEPPRYIETIPLADRAVIRQALLDWQVDGVANPLLPLDGDVDGDGVADAFALDPFGNLIIVPAVPITETVSQSVGGGVETDREDASDG